MAEKAMTFQQVPRRKLSESAAEQILSVVRDRAPGTRLPSERELSENLGVGRSTVREALQGLAILGFVEIRHGQGIFVATSSPPFKGRESEADRVIASSRYRDFFEARRIIEPELARLAARRRSDEEAAGVEAVLADHRRMLAANQAAFELAAEFHVLVADASGNAVLAGAIRPFFPLMVGPWLYRMVEGFASWELDEHSLIFEAIRDRDEERAARLMRAHNDAMWEHYASWLEAPADHRSYVQAQSPRRSGPAGRSSAISSGASASPSDADARV